MVRIHHRLLKMLVALLVTMFLANTVYASGMMLTVSSTLPQHSEVMEHNHMPEQSQAEHHQHEFASMHDEAHKPAPHSGCKHCNHCLACFSMITPSVIKFATTINKPVLAILYTSLYTSPTSPQLQKPPIA